MEHVDTKKLVKDGTEEVVEALDEQPFVIVVKTDTCEIPDAQITIMAIDPLDAVVLAAKCIDVYRRTFHVDPIVELMPFLEVDEQ